MVSTSSEPQRGCEGPQKDISTCVSEAELLRRGEIAAACYDRKVLEIQGDLIDSGVSGSEGNKIAQSYAISMLHKPDEYRGKFRTFIKPGVTRRSFVDDVIDLLADEDEALVTNTAIVGHEGIYPRSEEES